MWAYTNGDSAELILNGRSLGLQSVAPFDKASWFVDFEPGNLTLVTFRNRSRWKLHSLFTPGPAASIQLMVDIPTSSDPPLAGDGRDCAVLTASVVDAHGHLVSSYPGPPVTITVSEAGSLIGMGNGDPSDHSAEGVEGSSTRRALDGLVRVIVKSSSKGLGTIVVTARSPGLRGDTIELHSL